MLGLSLGQSLQLQQRVAQMLKIELRAELRLLLTQLLEILQQLIERQEISLPEVHRINRQLVPVSQEDLQDLAHEFVRTGKPSEVDALVRVLRFAMDRDATLNEVSALVYHIDRKRALRQAPGQTLGLEIGLRLILKDPDFMGGLPGTPENLVFLLENVWQYNDARGRYDWVLAGGWAVEVLTGEHLREHHDLDAVLLTSQPLYLDCDVVHTDDYFGVFSCGRLFIERHCIRTETWAHDSNLHNVAVLCPEFLFLSKILRPPRPQDWEDAKLLVEHFAWNWRIKLLRKLIGYNSCGFTRTRELMNILRSRDPDRIIAELRVFLQMSD